MKIIKHKTNTREKKDPLGTKAFIFPRIEEMATGKITQLEG